MERHQKHPSSLNSTGYQATPRKGLQALLSALLLTTSAWQAQASTASCGQTFNALGQEDTSISACMDELLSAQSEMIDALEQTVTNSQTLSLPAIAQARMSANSDLSEKIKFLRNEHARASQANKAVDSNDYDDMFTKADQKKGKQCKSTDIPFYDSLAEDNHIPPGYQWVGKKFGNGKCDVFEAEKLGDSATVLVDERAANMCQEECKEKLNSTGNALKNERKQRVAGRLDDGITTAKRATETLLNVNVSLTSLDQHLTQMSRLASDSDVCIPEYDVSALLETISTGVAIANSVVSFTTAALETAKENVKPAANQTVAGFNAGSTVIPFALVAGISKMAGEVIGGVEKGLVLAAQIASASADDTVQLCIKSVRDQGINLQTDVTRMKTDMEVLKMDTSSLKNDTQSTQATLAKVEQELAQLKALVKQNQQLLLTPQGRRAGFN